MTLLVLGNGSGLVALVLAWRLHRSRWWLVFASLVMRRGP